ncbi:hypothetical protein MPH_00335, partial [Macrophomina phaseolina MS6]
MVESEDCSAESSGLRDTSRETKSWFSTLPSSVSKEQRERVVKEFANGIIEEFQSRKLKLSVSPISHDRAKRVFATKLKRYAKMVTEDTPQTAKLTRKRNAAKTIFWYSNNIVEEFVKMAFPTGIQEQRSEGEGFMRTQEIPPESYAETVNNWDNNPDNVLHTPLMEVPVKNGSILPYDETVLEEPGDDEDAYPLMEFEPEEDLQNAKLTSDDESIRQHLTARKEFRILKSGFESITRHYYGDTMKFIQTSILESFRISATTFHAEFTAKWDIQRFLKEYRIEAQDMGQVLTITGNCHDAQMTTIDHYLQQTWPKDSGILEKLKVAVSAVQSGQEKP